MITIITDETVKEIGQAIAQQLSGTKDICLFSMDEYDIKPCYACDGCATKTYKQCVVRDDADKILPSLANSQTIVVITPITFGGYSYKTKRIIDKLPLISDLHYYYKRGELVKSLNPQGLQYYALGITDDNNEKENEVFSQLVHETLQLTSWIGKAMILTKDSVDISAVVKEVLS